MCLNHIIITVSTSLTFVIIDSIKEVIQQRHVGVNTDLYIFLDIYDHNINITQINYYFEYSLFLKVLTLNCSKCNQI